MRLERARWRASVDTVRMAGRQQPDRLLDLVLLHHSLAFATSGWKRVRQRLKAGTPLRVTLPSGAFNTRPEHEQRAWHHDDFRDHLRWDTAADTLFLVGSRLAFDLQADRIRGLAEDGAAWTAKGQHHYCAEITLGEPGIGARRRPCSDLHIVYRPRDTAL